MKKIKSKTTFKTDDGREFASEHDAACHEELANAKAQYEESGYKFSLLLAKRFKTADGCAFELDVHQRYLKKLKRAGEEEIRDVFYQ